MKTKHKARADIAALTDLDLSDSSGMPVDCPWCGHGWGPWVEADDDRYRRRTFTGEHGDGCVYVIVRKAWRLPPRHPGAALP